MGKNKGCEEAMMRGFLCLVFGFSLCGYATPAPADLTSFVLGDLTRRALACGRFSQGVEALNLTDRYPDFKNRFLSYAVDSGSQGWELEIVDVAFEIGVRQVMEKDFVKGVKISEEEKKQQIEKMEKHIQYCFE